MNSNPSSAPGERSPADMLQSIPGLDVERGLRFASGRLDTYVRRLRKYADSHLETARELRAAHAYRDPVELEHLAHSLRGLAAFLGAAQLQERATALEIGMRNEPDWDACGAAVESLCVAHEALLRAIASLPESSELANAA